MDQDKVLRRLQNTVSSLIFINQNLVRLLRESDQFTDSAGKKATLDNCHTWLEQLKEKNLYK